MWVPIWGTNLTPIMMLANTKISGWLKYSLSLTILKIKRGKKNLQLLIQESKFHRNLWAFLQLVLFLNIPRNNKLSTVVKKGKINYTSLFPNWMSSHLTMISSCQLLVRLTIEIVIYPWSKFTTQNYQRKFRIKIIKNSKKCRIGSSGWKTIRLLKLEVKKAFKN